MNPDHTDELARLRSDCELLRKERDAYRQDLEELRIRLSKRDAEQLDKTVNDAVERVKDRVWKWMKGWGALTAGLVAFGTAGGLFQLKDYLLGRINEKVSGSVRERVEKEIGDSRFRIAKLESEVDKIREKLVDTVSDFKAEAKQAMREMELEQSRVREHALKTREAISVELAKQVNSEKTGTGEVVSATAPPGSGNEVWFGLAVPSNVVAIAASRPDQFAYDSGSSPAYRTMGLFSSYFQKALVQDATDVNGNGIIAWQEAVQLTAKRMSADPVGQGKQNPVIETALLEHGLFRSSLAKDVPQKYTTVHALLIGINEYADGGSNLRGAVNDIDGFAALLKQSTRILAGNVDLKTIKDKAATALALKTAIAQLVRSTRKSDLAVLYYSGHVLTEPASNTATQPAKGIVPSDFNSKDFKGILVHEIVQDLGRCQGECVLIIDG